MSYDVSICVPGIRTRNWMSVYETAVASALDRSFEIVFVGPYSLPEDMRSLPNVKFIKDFGGPTRCAQIGATHCEGELFTTGTDDGVFVPGSIKETVDLYHSICSDQDGIIMRYTEGYGKPKTTKAHANNRYWTAKFHPTLNLAGVKSKHFWGLSLLKLSYFNDIGGFDCEYDHLNFPLHDLCYRIQKGGGGKMNLSPNFVLNADWDPEGQEYRPIKRVAKKDYAVFQRHWGQPSSRYKINFDNWKKSPARWSRFGI
jgi:hypothetical protein